MHSEKDLIERCVKGDRKAQKELYDRHVSAMLVVALRYSKARQEAEDIIQESFIKVFDKIKTYKGESDIKYWIKRIVVNTALNHQRSKLYMFPMVDVEGMHNDFYSEISLSSYHFKELLQMIQELPTGCQAIFNLYAIEGYNHQEIAEMLNISVGTSKSQYSRAKMLLKERIEKEQKVSYERARQ
ncbi:RNA polymerase sigma factor [Fulvivirga lutea]|uniref:RNA polymerase sigma factor n=1 Tax=Fulvivirga lutea TaxID=2810512 RepID=A0A974WK77_9BACT|nr:RNA polymerase sigma factor [Fulvivirga lutea]QSE96888.1 RNA polymerase sigma factor [Fulvivirga lutea]